MLSPCLKQSISPHFFPIITEIFTSVDQAVTSNKQSWSLHICIVAHCTVSYGAQPLKKIINILSRMSITQNQCLPFNSHE